VAALLRYVNDGRIETDKNVMAIYSLISTAKLNDIYPEAYLRDVLTRIADHRVIAHLLRLYF